MRPVILASGWNWNDADVVLLVVPLVLTIFAIHPWTTAVVRNVSLSRPPSYYSIDHQTAHRCDLAVNGTA